MSSQPEPIGTSPESAPCAVRRVEDGDGGFREVQRHEWNFDDLVVAGTDSQHRRIHARCLHCRAVVSLDTVLSAQNRMIADLQRRLADVERGYVVLVEEPEDDGSAAAS